MVHHLHFVSNLRVTDETKKSTKLWMLKPVFVDRKFLKSIFWGIQSEDGIMISFKGKSSLLQYIPRDRRYQNVVLLEILS